MASELCGTIPEPGHYRKGGHRHGEVTLRKTWEGKEMRAREWNEHFTQAPIYCHAMAHPDCMLGREKGRTRVGGDTLHTKPLAPPPY